MSLINIALIGCGGVARRYRRAYTQIAGARVAVTIDVDGEEAAAAARETRAPKASTNIEDGLGAGIDAVVISTPNHLHCDHAIRELKAGKHVLLQKPMATTVSECDAILKARDEAGCTLAMYMNLLDHPLFHDLRDLVHSGHLGTIALYSARLAHRGGLQWAGVDRNWRASRNRTGGGCFIQLGVHYQHFMRWALEAEVRRIQAMSINVACPHIEGDDLTLAQYELTNGALGEIQTSWCVQEEHLSLLGTKGSIHYRDTRRIEFQGEGGSFAGRVLSLRGDGSLEIVEDHIPPDWGDASNPYNQHRRFIEDLISGDAPQVCGEEGREDVRLVEACYESANSGRSVA